MTDTHANGTSYGIYWGAWLVLLAMTVAMVSIANPAVILAGITLKAAVITMWFMHLKYERSGLALTVAVTILFLSLLLFGLISIDAVPNAS
jgi:caa(3)-type oxidase subunit IV